MAHYAFLDENNTVKLVITGVDENTDLPEGVSSWEEFYGNQKGLTCKRTSYNTFANTHTLGGTPFRGNYAGVGNIYDEVNDVFYAQDELLPDGWSISQETWSPIPPIPKPSLTDEQIDDNYYYVWHYPSYAFDNTQGWILLQDKT